MLKNTFIVSLFCYVLLLGIYCFRGNISYRLVGYNPDTLAFRDLTYKEYKHLDQAFLIRKDISNLTTFISLMMTILAFFVRKKRAIRNIFFVKLVFWGSLLAFLVLFLASGVKFVPLPPVH